MKMNNDTELNGLEIADESRVRIKVPFDPNLIRIRRDPFTLGELIDKIEHDEINFFTMFQRKSGLWDKTQQGRLIESVLLKLPLPAFYFDENIEINPKTGEQFPLWQVIDGLQRCTALKSFVIDQVLKLENLEFLDQFNGDSFSSLPREFQRRIYQTPITVYVVENGTPEEVKFNIFKRINTGGLLLSAQEIRHALNQGIAAEFVAELADLKAFRDSSLGNIKNDRMQDRDFVTRFISFYLIHYSLYEPDLDTFMTKGMQKIKELKESERNKLKDDFEKALLTAKKIFGDDAFRRRKSPKDEKLPINKALFETLSVTISKLSDGNRKTLIDKAGLFLEKFIELNNNKDFIESLTSGTGLKKKVTIRFKEIERIVNETIGV